VGYEAGRSILILNLDGSGDRTGLLGVNGAGKSTKMIAGALNVSDGELHHTVRCGGLVPQRSKPRPWTRRTRCWRSSAAPCRTRPSEASRRSKLAQFGLNYEQTVASLSGRRAAAAAEHGGDGGPPTS
jgi:ATPase subunit of ABC transporter with duplicated ATPase domains